MSTSNNMLNILTLFTIEEPILDADIICERLGFSKPTGYRYIKDLVTHGLLQRLYGGQYTFGPKISVMDYIAQKSNPIIRLSIPLMQEIVDQTELNCCLTQMFEDYCIDIHHESYKESNLLAYGRGRPRPVFAGAAPKVILSCLPLKVQKTVYNNFHEKISISRYANNESEFIKNLNKIKKDGYYVSKGELEEHLGAIAVPIIYSNKAYPIALSVVGSVKRLNLIQKESIMDILQKTAKIIEQEFNQAE